METLKLIQNDTYLEPFADTINNRLLKAQKLEKELCGDADLIDFANGYRYYGLHKSIENNCWIFREWAPAAKDIYFMGNFSGWKPLSNYKLTKIENGNWEIKLPIDILKHEDIYKLFIIWEGGCGERIPAWATRVVQNVDLRIFNAQVWDPEDT